jgi:hypothetical protein
MMRVVSRDEARRVRTAARRAPLRAGPLLLALLLALPSANYQQFDGLPFSRAPEFLVLVLLIPLLASRGLRRLDHLWGAQWSPRLRAALAAVAMVALAVKLLLLASGTQEGFLACYRSTLEPPTSGACERSFEYPFARFSVTRVDPAIDFDEERWDLGFLNAVKFDPHYNGPRGRLRWRLPIEASWHGDVERPTSWIARISYVGEGTIVLDPGRPSSRAATRLPPRYGAIALAFVPVPEGHHSLEMSYRYDDGSTYGAPPPEGPWATLRIERGRGPGGREPGAAVVPVAPPWPWRALAALGDAAIAVLAASVLLFYAGLLWRDAWLLGVVGVVTPIADRFDPERLGIPSSLGVCLVLMLIAFPVLARRWRRRLVGAFFGLTYVAWFVTLHSFRRLDFVRLRDWAEDPLFYESQARSILDTWSLAGGEPIFVYQPLFRYIRFAERLVLGEGDGLVSVVAFAALCWALCWAFARLWARPRADVARRLLFGAVATLMLALASSPPVVFFIQTSLSEHPTWIFLALLFPMLVVGASPVQWRVGALFAGLSLLTRGNQAPGLFGLLGAFAWRAWPMRPRACAGALALVVLILSLPVWHNLYYGGQLALTGRSQPHLLRMPVALWPRVIDDPGVRLVALNQLDHDFYLNPVDDPPPRGDDVSRAAMRWLQILWLATWVLVLRRGGFGPVTTALLVALPLLYIGVHFVYVVDDYYPRHILVGHFAMGLVTLNAVGRGWRRKG